MRTWAADCKSRIGILLLLPLNMAGLANLFALIFAVRLAPGGAWLLEYLNRHVVVVDAAEVLSFGRSSAHHCGKRTLCEIGKSSPMYPSTMSEYPAYIGRSCI